MNQKEIFYTLELLKKSAELIPGVSLGVFGSVRYFSPRKDSDYDLFLVMEDNALEEIAGNKFMNNLFGEEAVNDKGTSLSFFEEEDLSDVLSDKVQILQAGGVVSLDFDELGVSGLGKVDTDVEIYAIRKSDLHKIVVEEPGGEVFQRYNTSPTLKSISPYAFITTSGEFIDYNQEIKLLDDEGRVFSCGVGALGGYSEEDAIKLFNRYEKKSPGLPRVDSTGKSTSKEGSIMIGTTGDKILSLSMLCDKNKVIEDIIIPAYSRVAMDFMKNFNNNECQDGFATLFQRYRLGRFAAGSVDEFNSLYKKAVMNNLSAADFLFDCSRYSGVYGYIHNLLGGNNK